MQDCAGVLFQARSNIARRCLDDPEHLSAIQVNVSLENYYRLPERRNLPDWRQNSGNITSAYRTVPDHFESV